MINHRVSPSLSSRLVADMAKDLAEEVLRALGKEALDLSLWPRITPLLTLAYLRYICESKPSFHSIVVGLNSPYNSPTVTHLGLRVETCTEPRLVLTARCTKTEPYHQKYCTAANPCVNIPTLFISARLPGLACCFSLTVKILHEEMLVNRGGNRI